MRKQRPLALIGAGPADNLALARLPEVAAHIGPVKASSFRLASRITNSIRSGYAVREYLELKDSHTILLCVPDRALKKIVSELSCCDLTWPQKTVVMVSLALSSRDLEPLGRLGASIASICEVEGAEGQRFLMEGDKEAIREIRKVLHPLAARFMELAPGRKDLCLAGLTFATSLFTPLIDAALQSLRSSGLPHRQALPLVERVMQTTLREYVKSGRKSWDGPLANEDWVAVRRQLDSLLAEEPVLARSFEDSARNAIDQFVASGGSALSFHLRLAR